MNASENLRRKAAVWHSQIAGVLALARQLGETPPSLAPYYAKLQQLYLEEGALAALQEDADILVRAQGPAVLRDPVLTDINWLFSSVQQQFKGLVAASFFGKTARPEILAEQLPVCLTGIAPGSFYAGFRIGSRSTPDEHDLAGVATHNEIVGEAKEALTGLTIVPGLVKDEEIDQRIYDEIPDPAIRDASLMAAFHLSPTGKRGIHTLEFSVPNSSSRPAELDVRHRVVLRETVVKKPILRTTKRGSFIGIMRGVDLDKTRVMLREVEGIGTLRCALQLNIETAKALLGQRVMVSGAFEENRSGKPGMLAVDRIEPLPALDL